MLALVRRELISAMRQPRAFLCLAILVVLSVLAVIARWPSDAGMFAQGGQVSRQLFSVFSMVLSAGAILLVPALAAGAFTNEKDNGTLESLKMTLIRPSGIVFGKALNVTGLFMLMSFATLPVLASVFFLLGVDVGQIVSLAISTFSSAFLYASIGLYWSARLREWIWATVACYVTVFCLMFFCMGFALPLSGLGMGGFGSFYYIYILVSHGVTIFVATMFLRATVRILRRPIKTLSIPKEKIVDDVAVLKKRRTTFPYFLVDPLKRKKPIEDGFNPIMVREIRWGIGQQATLMVRTFYVAVFISFFFSVDLGLSIFDRRVGFGDFSRMVVNCFGMQIYGIVAIAPLFLASAFSKEREQGNLDLLRTTLMSARSIVWGKLLAGVIAVSPLVLAVLFTSLIGLVAVLREGDGLVMLLQAYVTLGVSVLLSMGLSLCASVLCRRTATAIVSNFVLNILFFGALSGLYRLALLFFDNGYTRQTRSEAFVIFDFFSPIASLYRAASAGFSDGFFQWAVTALCSGGLALALIFFAQYYFQNSLMRD
jgi:ABC-type transport system involved in multi-copper enzyme maturation permease subunit